MSERRQPGDWVILEGGAIAQIQEENGEPEPCLRCSDSECLEWSTLLSRGGVQTFMHVSECQMAACPSLGDLPSDEPPEPLLTADMLKIPEPFTPFNLVHRLWTKAVGTKGYRKAEWMALERVILAFAEREKLVTEMEFLSEALLTSLNMGPVLNARAAALHTGIKGRRRVDISDVEQR